MIRATVETREGGVTRRASVIAPSVERALEMAGHGKPGHRVRVIYPVETRPSSSAGGLAGETPNWGR